MSDLDLARLKQLAEKAKEPCYIEPNVGCVPCQAKRELSPDVLLSLIARLEKVEAWANAKPRRAHTYASENADHYRGFDAGQDSAQAEVLRLLREERHD